MFACNKKMGGERDNLCCDKQSYVILKNCIQCRRVVVVFFLSCFVFP